MVAKKQNQVARREQRGPGVGYGAIMKAGQKVRWSCCPTPVSMLSSLTSFEQMYGPGGNAKRGKPVNGDIPDGMPAWVAENSALAHYWVHTLITCP